MIRLQGPSNKQKSNSTTESTRDSYAKICLDEINRRETGADIRFISETAVASDFGFYVQYQPLAQHARQRYGKTNRNLIESGLHASS